MRIASGDRFAGEPYLLIVDDEPSVLEVVRAMAGSLGWRPLLANTAHHALELFRAHTDAIGHVLLDLHMPGTDGAELARAVRALSPGVTIDLMTGDRAGAEALLAADDVADGVLIKPFTSADLGHALASHARAA